MTDTDTFDVAIVGGGISALSAGLFAAGFGLRTVVVTEIVMGGELINLEEVVQFPGITDPIAGSELASRVETQAIEAGVEFVFDEVSAITAEACGFLVTGLAGRVRAKTVVAAMGAGRRRLSVPDEEALEGRGVSYCGTCDGPFFKQKSVIVAGDSDFAGREALVVSRYADQVTLLSSTDDPSLSPATRQAIESNDRVQIRGSAEVIGLIEDDGLLAGVQVRGHVDDDVIEMAVSGLFVNRGPHPRTGLLAPLVALDADGTVPVDARLQTVVPGLFAVGELRSGFPGYAVCAASDGATAATAVRDIVQQRGARSE